MSELEPYTMSVQPGELPIRPPYEKDFFIERPVISPELLRCINSIRERIVNFPGIELRTRSKSGDEPASINLLGKLDIAQPNTTNAIVKQHLLGHVPTLGESRTDVVLPHLTYRQAQLSDDGYIILRFDHRMTHRLKTERFVVANHLEVFGSYTTRPGVLKRIADLTLAHCDAKTSVHSKLEFAKRVKPLLPLTVELDAARMPD